MDNQLQWTLLVNKDHIEQLMREADISRQLRGVSGNWKHQLAQTLQNWARKLEPELEQSQAKQLAYVESQ